MIQHNLLRAQNRMKHYADLQRSEKELAVGDMVYLKLQPYIQSSIAPRTNQKLSFRYYGPFKVLVKVGAVAYKLLLPDDCKIHPVVHISQLKRHIPASVVVEDDISAFPDDPTADAQPVHFLDYRMVKKGASCLSQIKVQWSGLPVSLATWEEASDLRRRFPNNAAWGQAAFRGGGNVRVYKKQMTRRNARTVGRTATATTPTPTTEITG